MECNLRIHKKGEGLNGVNECESPKIVKDLIRKAMGKMTMT